MPAAAMDTQALPPGYRFVPKEKELVEFYLLPRARGLQDPFPSVDIIEDDAAASTQPWKLFKRHSRSDDDEPYFYVNTSDTKAAGARQDRVVDGGFKWKSQKRVPGVLNVGGEKIKWSKQVLSLQFGDGGSLGWVMHEYTITEPNSASVKICHIAFTGHGQKRKRVPDGYDDCETQPKPQRARVDAAAAPAAPPSDSSTTETVGQETEHASEENACANQVPSDEYIAEMVAELADVDLILELKEQVPTTAQQVEDMPMVQESVIAEHLNGEDCLVGRTTPQCARVAAASSGSRTPTVSDQDTGGAAHASTRQVPCDGYIAEMVEEMTDAEATLELEEQVTATTEQQVEDDAMMPLPVVRESSTAEYQYAYPRLCGVPDVNNMVAGPLGGIVSFGGYCFC